MERRPGQFIRDLAKERGMSTRDMAHAVGVHPSTVRRALRDWEGTSGANAVKMALPWYLDMTPSQRRTFRNMPGAESRI